MLHSPQVHVCMRTFLYVHVFVCEKEQSVLTRQINEHNTLSMVLKISCLLQ